MMATINNAFPTIFQFNNCKHVIVNRNHVSVANWDNVATINLFSTKQCVEGRTLDLCNSRKSLSSSVRPLLAAPSGVEASISDENVVSSKKVNILVEVQDDDKMQVKVELPRKETQIVFDKVLTNLAHTAPPVPGFRRQKGGKTFKNDISVKDNRINTIQTIEDLQSSFTPGSDFGFNVTLEIEKPDTKTSSPDSSESSEA